MTGCPNCGCEVVTHACTRSLCDDAKPSMTDDVERVARKGHSRLVSEITEAMSDKTAIAAQAGGDAPLTTNDAKSSSTRADDAEVEQLRTELSDCRRVIAKLHNERQSDWSAAIATARAEAVGQCARVAEQFRDGNIEAWDSVGTTGSRIAAAIRSLAPSPKENHDG